VEEFVYLGSLIHSTTHSCPHILHCNAITHAAMQNLSQSDMEVTNLHIHQVEAV